MLPYAIDLIDESVLAALVTNQVAERRDLEFKRDLPGNKDDDVKEFLADVTSLANAQGGDLLFGIEDSDGIASAIVGLNTAMVDQAILRLESIMRDGIEPRLFGTRTQWIPLISGGGVIVIRIPSSFAAPHRVRFKNNGRFYNRNSRGKYEMDVHELRNAFTQSEGLPQRFRAQHDAGVAGARGIDMPFAIMQAPTAVATFMPTGMFRELRELNVDQHSALFPVKPSGSIDWMPTLEGFLVHTPTDQTGAVRSFAHTHRNGRFDTVWTFGGSRETGQGVQQLCWPDSFEEGLLSQATSAQAKSLALGLNEPWVVLVTIFGIEGSRLILSDHYSSAPAWRDGATLPQRVLEKMDEQGLMPLFKAFWLLFGKERPDQRQIGAA
jgi:hypothetical protein